MSARTILTLANGKGVDLCDPRIAASDFAALAEQLAKEKRYNGATKDTEYSVAEHCCLGADAILAHAPRGTGSAPAAFAQRCAAYFLLHDLHEALWKDDTTPKKRALGEIAEQHFGILANHIVEAFDLAVYRLDTVIHEAAGLQWPPSADLIPIIKHWDKVMFVTEWRDLMGAREHPDWSPYADVNPLKDKIGQGWRWTVARNAWIRRAMVLLPALSGQRA